MFDEKIFDAIESEEYRQREGLELIPSENYVSREVLAALGSVLTNKYAEGYPGRRYYGGQENTDIIESLAIERAKKLFKCDHANVQPHSGANANEAVYNAWLEVGDTVLGMDLAQGGHLTHGSPVTRSGKIYNFIRYGLDENGEINYSQIEEMAEKYKPKIILVGFSAYPGEIDYARISKIGKKYGAMLMADVAHIAGLISGGVLENPFDYGFNVVTTTTHKTLRGPRGGMILSNGKVGNPLKKPEKTLENLPTLIDRSVFPGTQGGPQMHSIAAKAVSFYEALQPEFKNYANQVVKNAKKLAEELSKRGFKLVTGGTKNHLILVDVYSSFGINGKAAERAMDKIGLTLNANSIPNDKLSMFTPSGIRLGTPAITSRGMKEEQMGQIAEWMRFAIENRDNPKELAKIKKEVADFARLFPLPSDL
ncbi:MAG: serine hydroxymethyltransferase [Candidatus Nanogingivalaceae bacterium]|jgi:glycine hydroxymethyltransferase|nr:serine hydroxymethyltransferase [Candidatus Nanogingivalaceae bacterium]